MFTKYRETVTAAVTLGMLAQIAPAFAQSYGVSGAPGTYGSGYSGNNYNNAQCPPNQGPSAYIPAGMTLSASLATSISTDVARPGDAVEARLSQPVLLGNAEIPAGSLIEGHVSSANAGGFLGRSGRLTVKFDRLRTPGGTDVPMAAHIVGDLGKYQQIANGSDSFAGETWKNKVGQGFLRTAIGAGAGAALGTAIGAIAGHGNPQLAYGPAGFMPYGHRMMPMGYAPYWRSGAALGAGRGAWSGAAIGGGVGLADSLLLRKGRNVIIASGTPVQLQLDAPVTIAPHAQYGAI